jgi:hypothetical protein
VTDLARVAIAVLIGITAVAAVGLLLRSRTN